MRIAKTAALKAVIRFLATTAIVGPGMAALPATAKADTVTIAIPAQSAPRALALLAQQSGVQIIYDSEMLSTVKTNVVNGKTTVSDALAQMFRGTAYKAVRTPGGSWTIKPRSNAKGAPGELQGNSAASLGEGGSSAEGSDIIVTGTNIIGKQPVGSPIVAYKRRDIDETGAASVSDFLKKIPQNLSVVDGVTGDYSFLTADGSGFSTGGTAANLRGLGPGATLVLVNGHRLATTGTQASAADVSLIPLSAVDRVEILSDGASSIYGADAVAGVINFILRRNFNGLEASGRLGTSTQGGGSERTASIMGGKSWTNGSGLISLERYELDPYYITQRAIPGNRLPGASHSPLGPDQRRWSLFGRIEQEFSPTTTFTADATLSNRHFTSENLQEFYRIDSKARAQSWGINVGVKQVLADVWSLRIQGNHQQARDTSYFAFTVFPDPNPPEFGDPFNSKSRTSSVDAIVEGAITIGKTSASIALGGSIRTDSYSITSTGATASVPANSQRTISSIFGELMLPLFPMKSGSPRAELSVSSRYDRYSDVGSALSPRVGLNVTPIDGLVFRTSYSAAFRAPALNNLTPGDVSYFVSEFPDPAFPGGTRAVLQDFSASSPDLKPEHSRSFSLGADYYPSFLDGGKISISYFHIDYKDRIASPPVPGGFADVIFVSPDVRTAIAPYLFEPAPPEIIERAYASGDRLSNSEGIPPSGITAYLDRRSHNIARSSTAGIDLNANLEARFGRATLQPFISVTYLIKSTFKVANYIPSVSRLNGVNFPIALKARAGTSVTRGSMSGSVYANYSDSYENTFQTAFGGVPDRVKSWLTVDANIAFSLKKPIDSAPEVQIALNIQNLFDSPPPIVTSPSFFPTIGFDPVNASALGRFISINVRAKF